MKTTRTDCVGAAADIELGLQWAQKIEAEHTRVESEVKLLLMLPIISICCGRFHEACGPSIALLTRGEMLGAARVQLGALCNLALATTALGQWAEAVDWSERMRALAESIGAPREVAFAQASLATAAVSLGDPTTAIRWCEPGPRPRQQ